MCSSPLACTPLKAHPVNAKIIFNDISPLRNTALPIFIKAVYAWPLFKLRVTFVRKSSFINPEEAVRLFYSYVLQTAYPSLHQLIGLSHLIREQDLFALGWLRNSRKKSTLCDLFLTVNVERYFLSKLGLGAAEIG